MAKKDYNKHYLRNYSETDLSQEPHSQMLKTSDILFEKIIGYLDEGVLLVDESSQTILSCNPTVSKLFGYKNKELIGEKYKVLLKNETAANDFENRLNTAITQEGVFRTRIKMKHKTGIDPNVEITVIQAVDANKISTSQVFVIKDVSRRQKIEEELIKTQKLESLAVLAGGIAHDFNNLLTVILGNISLTKLLSSLDQKTKKLLNNAEEASLRARDLTSQLLSLTKTSASHKGKMEVTAFLVPAVKLALSGSNIRYNVNLPENLKVVEVDEQQINQAIQNIIVNSREAMPNGGTINITARNTELELDELPPLKAGKYVVIAITDCGMGIAREDMYKIFDPYFSNKERGNKKGMGLGLTIAYSIIKKHGGTITVESEQDIGTTAYLYLPALESEPVPTMTAVHKILPTAVLNKGTFLIMDDEELVRDVLEKMLKLLGYKADCVANGQAAVAMYTKSFKAGTPYQAVLLDLTVPGGMGAEQTLKHLKNLDPNVRALVISGYIAHPLMQSPEIYGFCGAIAKPIRVEHLESITEILHKL